MHRMIRIAALGVGLLALQAEASFHTWAVQEIYSNADGTIQFIEMKETFGANFEHLFAGHSLTSNAHNFVFPTNLPSSTTANKTFILATAGFAALPGAVTPDYIIPNQFVGLNGDTLTLVGSIAGPQNIGPLPVTGLLSLDVNGTTAANSPTNFAGQAGSIDLSDKPIVKGSLTIELELVASGLNTPVYATDAGDGSGRLFLVDQTGIIQIIDAAGQVLPTPFLDLSSQIVTLNTGYDERGLLGLAFHPNYAANGRFFVRYSKARTGTASDPCFSTSRGCHEEILAEYSVSANPNVANPTGTILFRVDKPQFNHNAGQVLFGPDGYLYFTLGDGGGANDGLSDSPPSHGPIGNAQNLGVTLGKVLRIDVDSAAPYAIPADNPFVGDPNAAHEVYAYGLRNPYRFSFDSRPGGNNALWLADVGQNLAEEVDIIEKGLNYGWVLKEGNYCFDPFAPSTPPPTCNASGFVPPVAQYTHTANGIAVVGGYIYRGSNPDLLGLYVFGDFSVGFGAPEGRLFYLNPNGNRSQVLEFRIGAADNPLAQYLRGLGQDQDGEIYVLTSTLLGPQGTTGKVYRIRRGPDDDLDGVVNAADLCPGTIPAATVDANGCPPLVPGDIDRDGDVDSADLTLFVDCAWGPALPSIGGCERAHIDNDNDVDSADFGALQRCLSGAGVPGSPACAN